MLLEESLILEDVGFEVSVMEEVLSGLEEHQALLR